MARTRGREQGAELVAELAENAHVAAATRRVGISLPGGRLFIRPARCRFRLASRTPLYEWHQSAGRGSSSSADGRCLSCTRASSRNILTVRKAVGLSTWSHGKIFVEAPRPLVLDHLSANEIARPRVARRTRILLRDDGRHR